MCLVASLPFASAPKYPVPYQLCPLSKCPVDWGAPLHRGPGGIGWGGQSSRDHGATLETWKLLGTVIADQEEGIGAPWELLGTVLLYSPG